MSSIIDQLLAAGEEALNSGDEVVARQYFREAGQQLQDEGEISSAADVFIKSGDLVIAADLLEQGGYSLRAAQLHGQVGDFARAGAAYVSAGEKLLAARVYARALQPEAGISRRESKELARRAGVLYAEVGRIDEAVQVLSQGEQLIFAAELLEKEDRLEEAVSVLEDANELLTAIEVCRRAGMEDRANFLLAKRAENEGRFSVSANYYAQAGSYENAARLYELEGEYPSAARMHERAGKMEVAAGLYERVGRLEEAQRCYEAVGMESAAAALTARSSRRDHSIAQLQMSGEYLRAAEANIARARSGEAERYERAEVALSRIEPGTPDYIVAQTRLAELLEEKGDLKGALAVLRTMLGGLKNPTKQHVPALYHYGRIAERLGKLAQARQIYRSAGELDPDYKDLMQRKRDAGSTQVRVSIDTLKQLQQQKAVTISTPKEAEPPPNTEEELHSPALDPSEMPVEPSSDIPRGDLIAEEPLPGRSDSVREPELDQLPPVAMPEVEQGHQEPPAELIGMTIRRRFRVEKKIGTGAQATVYFARDILLDSVVAIKVLHAETAADQDVMERFIREARLASGVDHPNCLSIFDFGSQYGLSFIVMEYFAGSNVAQIIKAKKGPLSPPNALNIGLCVARALEAIHESGIIHRDVKATNVMINKEGEVRLMDFGVAKKITEETSRGMMLGTIAYMAPEQARGKEIDVAADIFALGVVLFEMLVGKKPWGTSIEALIARANKLPPPLPDRVSVTEQVTKLIRQCMHPKSSERPDMAAVIQVLESSLGT